MKILFDMLHPAHFHKLFPIWKELKKQGHKIIITARDKDVTYSLLKKNNINFIPLSKQGNGKLSLLFELIIRNLKLIRICLKENPDILIGFNGISISQVGWLLRIPSIYITDNENAKYLTWFGTPFATKILTEESFMKSYESKHYFIKGFFENTYLNSFIPDSSVLYENNLLEYNPRLIRENPPKIKPFAVVRFVAWKASHDFGEAGFNIEQKKELIKVLEKKGKIIISSEEELPKEFKKYENKSSPNKIHSLLYYAQVYIGDSQAMANESGILGTPAIRCNSLVDTNHSEGKFFKMTSIGRVYSTSKPKNAIDMALSLYGKKKPILKNKDTIPSIVYEILNSK